MSTAAVQTRPTARSFTLVEIMIVLAVILVLVTLVVSVSSALVKRAERTQTEAAITTVESAMNEWEAIYGRPITFGTMNSPAGSVYDIKEMPPATGRYLAVFLTTFLAQDQSVKAILATIPTDMLRRDPISASTPVSPPSDPTYPPSVTSAASPTRFERVDTWGKRIAMVFPGRTWRVGDAGLPDADGTIRTADENSLGVCENRRPCFISSGPDGLLGTEAGLTAQQRLDAIADNIYSYELLPIN